MKVVYCSNCGTRLAITRKALPKYGRIIDLIQPHVCLAEPIEFDLTPVDVPTFTGSSGKDDGKFVQKLNELFPLSTSTDNLKDRRKTENIKSEPSSSAPRTLLSNMKAMHNTTPVHDVGDEPKEE